MHTRKLHFLFACLLLANTALWSQDIHFTQFNMAPISLNPALTGKFEGTARFGGIYRGQWASILGTSQQFSTPSAWIDAPIIRGIRKKDWLGIGLMLFNDRAGALGLTHGGGGVCAGYHMGFGKKSSTVLSFGLIMGGENRKLNPLDRARLEDGFNNSGDYISSLDNFATNQKKYSDRAAGIGISSKLNKRMDFSLGFSAFHLGRPRFSLVDSSTTQERLQRRFIGTGAFNMALTDVLSNSASFLYQTMGGADEIAIQDMVGLLFNKEKDITLKFGLGYRLGDAAQILLGYQQKDLQVGIAYDVNISPLSAQTNYRGGFEIAANYIVKKYKKPDPKAKILCPRF